MPTLLSVSLIGGAMILVITGLRALLQNRLHRTVFLLLWLLAALRLVIPVELPSMTSVYNLLPHGEGRIEVVYITNELGTDISMDTGTVPPDDVQPVMEEHSVTGDAIVQYVWISGAGLCLLYFVWIHIRARLRYRFALPEEGPAFLGNVRLKRSDQIASPMVYGFFRPVILLPYDFPKKDSPEYEQVLQHELTHVRSGDLWFKLGMLLTTCIHWFNPLVWLMLHLSTQDLELRCDARVIRKLGKKKAYAMALLQAEAQRTDHFAEAAFAFSLTEMRLKAISRTKVYLPRSILLCTILAVVLVCCFATGPVSAGYAEVVILPSETENSVSPPHWLSSQDTSADEDSSSAEPKKEDSAYLMEYDSDAEQSLKEDLVEAVVPGLPKHTVPSTAPQGSDSQSTHNHDGETETPTGSSGDRDTSATGQPVRSSNANGYTISIGDFSAAFSGTDAWANQAGETFDPFHR